MKLCLKCGEVWNSSYTVRHFKKCKGQAELVDPAKRFATIKNADDLDAYYTYPDNGLLRDLAKDRYEAFVAN
jgi:hypothetical protein